jgi:hypothetical protein
MMRFAAASSARRASIGSASRVVLTVRTIAPPGLQMRISSSSPSAPTWPVVKTPTETMPAKAP